MAFYMVRWGGMDRQASPLKNAVVLRPVHRQAVELTGLPIPSLGTN